MLYLYTLQACALEIAEDQPVAVVEGIPVS